MGTNRTRGRSRPTRPVDDGVEPEGLAEPGATDADLFAAMADLGIDVDAVGEASREGYARYLRQQKRCHR